MVCKTYDVVVVGGGSGGIAAAIGAVRAGAKTLLIERNGSLGGQATNSNVASYCGFFTHGDQPKQIVHGVGGEIIKELEKMGGCEYKHSTTGNAIYTFDEEMLKYTLDRLVKKYQLELLLHCRLIGASMTEDGTRIGSIRCVDDEQEYCFEAVQFVDATGDANLAHLAGAEVRFGDGAGGGYLSTKMMRIDHVDPSADFAPAALEKALKQAKADGISHLTKEAGIVFRTHYDTAYAILPSAFVPSLDAKTLTEIEMDTREQCQDYMKAFRKYVPGMEHARLVSTGYKMGLRDTRHIIGKYMITKEDAIHALRQEDGVAKGAWPCEMHSDINKMLSYIWVKDNDYYDIPLRALESVNIDNLFSAGRTISADPTAFASVRVMGTSFATGHAAGVAAACRAADPQSDIKKIRNELNAQGAEL